MFQYEFMRQAFIASTFIAITCGLIGVFVVARSMSFLSHTLSEIGFAGAAFGVFVGGSPLVGMIGFTLISSILVGSMSSKKERSEASTSAISSLFIGAGILFLALSSKTSSYATNILFGSVVGITTKDLYQLVILAIIILLLTMIFFRALSYDSFDSVGAKASGLPTVFLSVIFLIMMALSVSIGAQVVGSLLVFVLLTLPGATAKFFVHSVGKLFAVSVGLSLIGVWLGLVLGYYTNLPVTFFISIFEVLAYLTGLMFNKIRHN